MNFKKIISIFLALIMAFSFSVISFAETEEDYGIMLCYEYINRCTSVMSADGTTLNFSSTVNVDPEYTVSISFVLESSENGVDGWKSKGSYYPTVETCVNINVAGKTIYNVDRGLYYRANATIRIYDSHGRRLETENYPSNVVYVP